MKLADFIHELNRRDRTTERCLRRLHLVAHSRGNQILRFALQDIKPSGPIECPRCLNTM
ncbi:hypothetical protein IQ273_27950 [Nodosilinea sp. LEGE 07298]|uniref:hypothetical protein n=1 Tax=Nodosilinea sp. LEGE 07298 TaxID=2777970 RepID=UPI0018807DC4|nr:hypothetical protein [Nodosilinea sp. LEGE 07298]MBE9113219.1 hypothetical protein [Nodosilinea sp. LEGE 07298]